MSKNTRPKPGPEPSRKNQANARRPLRSYKPRPAGSLEEATDALFAACGGGKAAAELPGCYVGPTMLGTYSNADDPDVRNKTIPAKLAAYLEAHSGVPAVSSWMAHQSGHVLIRPPVLGVPQLTALAPSLGKESAEVFARLGEALADNRLTADERTDLIKELYDVVGDCAGAIEHLEAGGE